MLQRIRVHGFRSLTDFQLNVRPGLNVLVGPNGAGKTNIILFFEFLRTLSVTSVDEAIAQAGGVAQVFTKLGRDQFSPEMFASVIGTIEADNKRYRYSYRFGITFNAADQNVTFRHQHLRIVELDRKQKSLYPTEKRTLYADIRFEAGHSVGEDDHVSINGSPEFLEANPFLRDKEQALNLAKSEHARQHAVLSFLFGFDRVESAIRSEFSGRFALNVVPSHVKKSEDSVRKPGIHSDGSGVSATLFAIQRGKVFFDEGKHHALEMPSPLKPSWDHIIELIRIAVPWIRGINVISDPFDNLLRCQIEIKNGEYDSFVPLSALSDGTVKWISLILRLATSNSALLLEEPENFLHPLMQREIVRLLRDSVAESGFTIVSTHSETLINAVRAKELVIVDYSANGTRAKRVTNAEDVEREVNETGFSLGYYYLARAVET